MEKFIKRYGWLLVAILIFSIDYGTKKIVLHSFSPGESVKIFSLLNLLLLFNSGAAFSLFAQGGSWQRWFFLAIGLVVSLLLIRERHTSPGPNSRLEIAIALILGGCWGNMYDRCCYGMVVDFIQLHLGNWYFPVFNLADVAITLGALIFGIELFIRQLGQKRS